MAMFSQLRHFLDEYDEIPDGLPGPARNLALFLGSIVEWVTIRRLRQYERTNVSCRRRPGRCPCPGAIYAALEADGASIAWECPLCGDCGVITGWESTTWDRSEG